MLTKVCVEDDPEAWPSYQERRQDPPYFRWELEEVREIEYDMDQGQNCRVN